MGAVTPLGNSVAETWEGICHGKSGIGKLTKFDCTAYETRIAGELKGFDPLQYVNRKELRRLDDFIIYALAASEMALADAGLTIGAAEAERTGVIIGSAIGGLATIEKEKEAILLGGPRKMSAFTIPAVLANLAAGHVSIRFGAKGPINCSVTACASGTCAIGDAGRLIAEGYADCMIAGGVEAAVTPLCVAGFNAMRAISTHTTTNRKRRADPSTATATDSSSARDAVWSSSNPCLMPWTGAPGSTANSPATATQAMRFTWPPRRTVMRAPPGACRSPFGMRE